MLLSTENPGHRGKSGRTADLRGLDEKLLEELGVLQLPELFLEGSTDRRGQVALSKELQHTLQALAIEMTPDLAGCGRLHPLRTGAEFPYQEVPNLLPLEATDRLEKGPSHRDARLFPVELEQRVSHSLLVESQETGSHPLDGGPALTDRLEPLLPEPFHEIVHFVGTELGTGRE